MMMLSWGVLALLAALGCMGLGIWLLATCRRPVPGGEMPRCGACGYNLTGLDGNYCPECGRKFIDAGVVKASNQRRTSVGRIVLGITLLLAPPELLLLGLFTARSVGASRARAVRAVPSVPPPAADPPGSALPPDPPTDR